MRRDEVARDTAAGMALLSFHKLRQEGGRLLNFQHQPIDGYRPPLKSRHNFA